ncbi:STAS domain-containing protein [Streptomyces goshikiensis]|uniref:STAS domain-containing protein n=1 Tax=Streptomyces goshikiensis TaxID=1942 RepID=UPI00369A0462
MGVRQDGQSMVLALRGELDYDSLEQLQEAGERELVTGRAGGPLVIDCAELAFCDSSGIGALLGLHQQMSAQSRALRLASVPASVARLLELTGLDQVLSVHPDVADALARDRQHPDAARTSDPAQPNQERRA